MNLTAGEVEELKRTIDRRHEQLGAELREDERKSFMSSCLKG